MCVSKSIFIYLALTFLFCFRGQAITCYDYLSSKQINAMKVEEYTNSDEAFLSRHPVCKGKVSCIQLSKIQVLKENNLFPRPVGSSNFFDKDYKSDPSCSSTKSEVFLNTESESRFMLSLKNKIMPKESILAKELLLRVKANVDDYLGDSTLATQKIAECLKFNETFENEGVPFHKRGILALKKETIPPLCQRIWSAQSEIPKLNTKLKEYRQTIFLLNLTNQKKFKKLAEVKLFIERASDESDVGYNTMETQARKALEAQLIPSKIHLFDTELPSALWDNSPDKLEKLNSTERHGLLKVFNSLEGIDENSEISDLNHSLSRQYFKILNENPLLLEFKTAQPGAKELKEAFLKFHSKTKLLADFKLNDITDYLSFSTAVDNVILNSSEEEQGDLCVLASQIIADKKKMNNTIENILLTAMAIESLGAAFVAKGAIKKTLSFLMGAKYSGTALQVKLINDSMKNLEKNLQTCLRTTTFSKSLCQVNQINSSQSDIYIQSAFLGMFMFSKKLAPFIVGPAVLNKDNAK